MKQYHCPRQICLRLPGTLEGEHEDISTDLRQGRLLIGRLLISASVLINARKSWHSIHSPLPSCPLLKRDASDHEKAYKLVSAMAPSTYDSICGRRVRDPEQVAEYSSTKYVLSVHYCLACLLERCHGQPIMERNDFGSIQGRLQSQFPEQCTRRDEHIKVEGENTGKAHDHNALELCLNEVQT